MMTWILGHILAVSIGISLGLIGGGGSSQFPALNNDYFDSQHS